MFIHVVKAQYIDGYKVLLTFNNGVESEIDLSEKLAKKNGVFTPVKQIEYFKQCKVINDTLG